MSEDHIAPLPLPLPPLRFEPIIKRAIWGGSRLRDELGKSVGPIDDAAESWEICGLPGNESIVVGSDFHGKSIQELLQSNAQELLGQHAGCTLFPLLVKFIDANQQLSVQVHPGKATAGADGRSKAEAWIVLATTPQSRMYVGLQNGVDEPTLRAAVASGNFGDCLHVYQPEVGDCLYLEPGTVHALGGDLLIAEIQEPSNTTYRLHDWGRVDSAGRSRELHVEAGFQVTNFERGPVLPVQPVSLNETGTSELLVKTPSFVIHRHRGPGIVPIGDDSRMHVLTLLTGNCQLAGPQPLEIKAGETIVLPAVRESIELHLDENGVLLDAFLPDDFELI